MLFRSRTESRRGIRAVRRIQDKISGFKAAIAQIEAHESRTRLLIRVQNQSSWTVCSATAAARGGAREGRPRQSTIRPMYHWTDSMIRVHVFYCVLALTIASLLVRQLHLKGIDVSIPHLFGLLNQIHELALIWPRGPGRQSR